MRPKSQGACLRYCLLCSRACHDKPTDKGSQEGDGGGEVGGGGVNCTLLKDQLKNMFVLLKLLDVPKSWCEGILGGDDEEEIGGGEVEGGNNPDSWFTLCDKCDDDKVQKAWLAYQQMLKWGGRLNAIKVQIKEEMRKGIGEGNCFKERFYSDDGIEVVNFEVGKLLFPDLFEEIIEDEEEEDDVAFSSDSDVDNPSTDLIEGRQAGSGTQGESLSIILKSGPESAGARFYQSNGQGEKKRGRGRPRKVDGAIKVNSLSCQRHTTPQRHRGRGRPKRPRRSLNFEEESQPPPSQINEQAYHLSIKERLAVSVAINKMENRSVPPPPPKNGTLPPPPPLENGPLPQPPPPETVKRGRGRPRKLSNVSSSPCWQERKRLRGRPRKKMVPLRLST